jgi:hypothetical protein
VGGETGVAVTDDLGWKSEPSVNIIQVQLGNPSPGYGCCTGQEYCCPRASVIHDSEDGIFSVVRGEARDEIHCYLLEGKGVVGRRDAVWGSACLVGYDLVLLAYCASLYVVRYPCVHSFPLAALLYPSYCFISSWVASHGVVVRLCH